MTPRFVLDRLLDASIVFSFDRTGFARHAAAFRPDDLPVDLSGRTALVTGANSGLGLETSRALASMGARVLLLCRRREAGEEARRTILAGTPGADLRVERLDVSDLADVAACARRLGRERVDVLVNNAGVLPGARLGTPQGLELTLATNLAGPFLLTRLLLPRLARSSGRVVMVSSGGMYTQKLDVARLEVPPEEPFDGVVAYARTKRALVVLTGLLSERYASRGVSFFSMHPGWADTPAVASSIPRFHRATRAILRTPCEGADTVVWLAACPRLAGRTGGFWFDRQEREEHLLPWTREGAAERERLWELLERVTGPFAGDSRRRR